VRGLRKDLEEAKTEVINFKQVKDQFKKEAEFLEKDRGYSAYKYQMSIEDIMDRTRELEQSFAEIHQVLWNYDQRLSAQFMGLSDIESVIHVGRLGETEKRDTMLADIEAKSKYVSELLKKKEELEVEMAPAGVVNFIYNHLAEIQEELRGQIKVFVRHKASMVHLLELMLNSFKENNNKAVEQTKNLRREAAKERAFECILNTKMISNKILAELLKKANGGKSTYDENSVERFSYNAEAYEKALEEKYQNEAFIKNRDITTLKEKLGSKDQEINLMREQLAYKAEKAK